MIEPIHAKIRPPTVPHGGRHPQGCVSTWAAGFAGRRYGSDVGFYREHVLPRLVERACSTAGMTSWRAAVTEGLEGRVVEIGFG